LTPVGRQELLANKGAPIDSGKLEWKMLDDQFDWTTGQEYVDWKLVSFQQEAATGEVAISPPIDLFNASHSESLGQVESIGLALQERLLDVGRAAEKAVLIPARKRSLAEVMIVLMGISEMEVYSAILFTLYTDGLGQCFGLGPTVYVIVSMCLRVSVHSLCGICEGIQGKDESCTAYTVRGAGRRIAYGAVFRKARDLKSRMFSC
jgi:hypothetical protein